MAAVHTDERNAEDLRSTLPGIKRVAEFMQPYTPEVRDAIAAAARYMMNMTGCRYSDAVWSCARAYDRCGDPNG